jgi:hypothetical protein
MKGGVAESVDWFNVAESFQLQPRRLRNVTVTLALDLAPLIEWSVVEVLQYAPEYNIDHLKASLVR